MSATNDYGDWGGWFRDIAGATVGAWASHEYGTPQLPKTVGNTTVGEDGVVYTAGQPQVVTVQQAGVSSWSTQKLLIVGALAVVAAVVVAKI